MCDFKHDLFFINSIALQKGWMSRALYDRCKPESFKGEVFIHHEGKYIVVEHGDIKKKFLHRDDALKQKWVDFNLRNAPKAIRKALGEHDVFKTLLGCKWRCVVTKPVSTLPVFRENFKRQIDLVGRALVATGCDEKGKLNGTFKFNVPDQQSAYIVVDQSLMDDTRYATIYVLSRKY